MFEAEDVPPAEHLLAEWDVLDRDAAAPGAAWYPSGSTADNIADDGDADILDWPGGPSVDDVIDAAESAPVTPALIAQLAALDLASLDDGQRVAVTVGWDRVRNYAEAQLAISTVAVVEAMPATELFTAEQLAAAELGPALRIGTATAQGLVTDARTLTRRLPDTLGAVREGGVSWRKATMLAEHTSVLSDDKAAAVEAKVLP